MTAVDTVGLLFATLQLVCSLHLYLSHGIKGLLPTAIVISVPSVAVVLNRFSLNTQHSTVNTQAAALWPRVEGHSQQTRTIALQMRLRLAHTSARRSEGFRGGERRTRESDSG